VARSSVSINYCIICRRKEYNSNSEGNISLVLRRDVYYPRAMKSQLFYLGLLTICGTANGFAAAIKPWGHYSTIGYRYEQRPDEDPSQSLGRFCKTLLRDPSTEKIRFDSNNEPMYRSATPCGAELWCAVTRESGVLGFEPHFFGSSRVRVEVTGTNEDWSGLEAWIEAHDKYGFPLEFACPNNAIHKDRLKSFVDIQLAAFASEIDTFDTLEKYAEEQSKLPNVQDIIEGKKGKRAAWPRAPSLFFLPVYFLRRRPATLSLLVTSSRRSERSMRRQDSLSIGHL